MTTPGEDLAATRLFEQYGERIYRYCLVRLRSREEAEDAVQSTFLRVQQALHKGTTPRWEEAWLFTIARNVCLTRYAANRRRTSVEVARDPDGLESAADETPADALLGLRTALAVLPANLRTAFLLREWRGLSYAEIAETMHTTVSAVETLIVRARRRLANELGRAVGSIGGFLLPFAGRMQAAFVASVPAKVVAGTALLVVGAAGFGAAVVGTTSTAPHSSAVPERLTIVHAVVIPRRHAHPALSSSHAVAAVPSPRARRSVRTQAPTIAVTTADAATTATSAPATTAPAPSVASTTPTPTVATTAVSTLAAAPAVAAPALPQVPQVPTPPVTVEVTVPPLPVAVQVPQPPPLP